MTLKSAIAAAAFATLVSGCLPNDPTVGTGPITLSPETQQNYEAYLEERSPGYFVVTEDGQGSFYNYCSAGRCYRTSANRVIHECEKRADGRSCKVYASKGHVVWKTNPETATN